MASSTNGKFRGFFAFPSYPTEVCQTIRHAVDEIKKYTENPKIESWEEMDIFGKFIASEIKNKIKQADFLIADITEPNYNVAFEIGYAIGKGKSILLTRNRSIISINTISDLGLFDTIGYYDYQNSRELIDRIRRLKEIVPLSIDGRNTNKQNPIYLIEAKYKTDIVIHIISRLKKTGLRYRNFDPQEKTRLSAFEAIEQVEQSIGVLLYFLPDTQEDYIFHNMRVAFLAGLADGMGKILTIMQLGDFPIPLDVRDIVFSVRHPKEAEDLIHDFAVKIIEEIQKSNKTQHTIPKQGLSNLNLGASSAENELTELQEYYLETDEFKRAQRGETRIVVGRKGSGKTAIFIQVRESYINKTKALVLDLKPDGFKLLKFKESVLGLLKMGTLEHTLMAFWEYLLLLELGHKIIETDKKNHLRDPNLYESYNKILSLYTVEGYDSDGDFSERMANLIERIRTDYEAKNTTDSKTIMSSGEITELMHIHDVKQLRVEIETYLKNKEEVWLLFDNIDKGWPSHGLQKEDIAIVRELIEALRKLERQMQRHGVKIHSILFLRNDVYELLIQETSDRGKEAKATIDWKDPDHLKEVIRRRLLVNDMLNKTDPTFENLWRQICTSHYRGEETANFFIDRSLMRPRHLIDMINHCKSYAVNLSHSKIETDDIEKGMYAYSSDLITNINLEIADISAIAENVLYAFIESPSMMSHQEMEKTLSVNGKSQDEIKNIIEILLWHGAIGIIQENTEAKYIYNYNYDFQLMKAFILKKSSADDVYYHINPAFWPALGIKG